MRLLLSIAILLSVVVISSVSIASAISDEDRIAKIQAGIDKLLDRINVLENKKIDLDDRIDDLKDKIYKKQTLLNKVSGIPVFSDFDLDADNEKPTGIIYLNGNLWVVDNGDDKVYAYNADGTLVLGSDFDLASGSSSPAGITSFNGKFYVLDRTNSADKVYAYNADGTRAASLDFDLPSDNTSSFGITALYDKFYVVDLDDTVYAYNTADGSRAASSDFSLKKDSSPDGITSLHGKLWVVDGSSPDSVYPYNQTEQGIYFSTLI